MLFVPFVGPSSLTHAFRVASSTLYPLTSSFVPFVGKILLTKAPKIADPFPFCPHFRQQYATLDHSESLYYTLTMTATQELHEKTAYLPEPLA